MYVHWTIVLVVCIIIVYFPISPFPYFSQTTNLKSTVLSIHYRDRVVKKKLVAGKCSIVVPTAVLMFINKRQILFRAV